MNKHFWEKEYKDPKHLTMSDDPSSDLATFVKWAIRNSEWPAFPEGGIVLDIGCGNGRNIIALCEESQMRGSAFDISAEAVRQAKSKAQHKKLDIDFYVKSADEKISLPDASVDVALDMMVSHFLNEKQRRFLYKELARVVKPFGWLFFKTFVLDGDSHARRLLETHPGEEWHSYTHPRIKVQEHVFTEAEIIEEFGPYFVIHKMIKSYKHVKDGVPHKRRTVSVYMERKRDE